MADEVIHHHIHGNASMACGLAEDGGGPWSSVWARVTCEDCVRAEFGPLPTNLGVPHPQGGSSTAPPKEERPVHCLGLSGPACGSREGSPQMDARLALVTCSECLRIGQAALMPMPIHKGNGTHTMCGAVATRFDGTLAGNVASEWALVTCPKCLAFELDPLNPPHTSSAPPDLGPLPTEIGEPCLTVGGVLLRRSEIERRLVELCRLREAARALLGRLESSSREWAESVTDAVNWAEYAALKREAGAP